MKTKITLALVVLLLAQLACRASERRAMETPAPAEPISIPEKYYGLYETLNRNLDADLAAVQADPAAGRHTPVFAAELLVADDNRGEALLVPETLPAVGLYLDRLQAMGVSGVKSALQFPFFTPDFPRYSEYLDFYREVGEQVRAHNMTWTIQSSILFANSPFSLVTYDFSGLTFEQYKQQDRAMIETILRELKPDYLVVIAEPDTAAKLTGLSEFNDPHKGVELTNYLLDGLDRGSTKICAGTGTWTPVDYVRALAEQTALDCISLHVYPVDPQFIQNGLAMADVAHANGKSVVITEAWLYKTDQPGGGNNVAATADIFRLDAYSFWAPLDEKFFQLMADFADKTQADFLSFFWSPLFFSYMDYTPALDNSSYEEARKLSNQASYEALTKGELSPLGKYYRSLIEGR